MNKKSQTENKAINSRKTFGLMIFNFINHLSNTKMLNAFKHDRKAVATQSDIPLYLDELLKWLSNQYKA